MPRPVRRGVGAEYLNELKYDELEGSNLRVVGHDVVRLEIK
jgi:hypothetical protein